MTLFRNVVLVAAIAGLLASLVMTALQSFATVPLILEAETYESAGEAHSHDHGTAAESAAPAVEDHHHDEEAWAPADGFERFFFTFLANLASGFGLALIMIAISEFAGGITSWRAGLLWGFAGFAAFTLAPGLGLPPELPGMPAADLGARQVWWFTTVIATAGGLALIAFRGTLLLSIVGVALIVAPHVIGAPQPVSHATDVPADLHHRFVVASTMTMLVFWVLLGGLAGAIRSRFAMAEGDRHGQLA
jgi:cobalt transporter subunit CbtA (proposed)